MIFLMKQERKMLQVLRMIKQSAGAAHPHPPPSVRDHSPSTSGSGHETGDGGGRKKIEI